MKLLLVLGLLTCFPLKMVAQYGTPNTSPPPLAPSAPAKPKVTQPPIPPKPAPLPPPVAPRRVFNPEQQTVPPIAPPENPPRFSQGDAQEILEVIENQLNAIQSKKYSKAYMEYTSDALRQRTTLDQFIYFVKGYSVLNHNKNALFGAPEFTQHIAIFRGVLTGTDGQAYKAEYHLIKEGNHWKVQGLQLFPIIQGGAPTPTAPHPVPAGANYDFQGDISSNWSCCLNQFLTRSVPVSFGDPYREITGCFTVCKVFCAF